MHCAYGLIEVSYQFSEGTAMQMVKEKVCEHLEFHEEEVVHDYYNPGAYGGHGQYVSIVLVCDACEEVITKDYE